MKPTINDCPHAQDASNGIFNTPQAIAHYSPVAEFKIVELSDGTKLHGYRAEDGCFYVEKVDTLTKLKLTDRKEKVDFSCFRGLQLPGSAADGPQVFDIKALSLLISLGVADGCDRCQQVKDGLIQLSLEQAFENAYRASILKEKARKMMGDQSQTLGGILPMYGKSGRGMGR